MKHLMKYSAIAAGVVASVSALAETETQWNCYENSDTDFNSCFYIGAGLGYAHLDPDTDDTGWKESGKNNLGGLVYAGYHFAPQWFVEAAYTDLGEVDLENKNLLVRDKGSIDYQVPNIMAGYYLDVPSWLIDPFVKVGVSAIQNSVSDKQIEYEEETSAQLALAAGFEWRFAKHWKLRNVLESYDEDAMFYSLSVAYIFGEGKARPAPAPEPEPVPPPVPVPEPVVEVVPPAPVVTQELCEVFDGSLEGVHFKTASAELTDSARSSLAKTAKVLRQFPNIKLSVHAHTDSQGSEEYNHELSKQRARSVHDFFVSEGVADERMRFKGYGESQPIADNATADGRALNRRVELVSQIEQCKQQ